MFFSHCGVLLCTLLSFPELLSSQFHFKALIFPGGGACCFEGDFCFDNTQDAACLSVGGLFLGEGLTCRDDPDGDGTLGCHDHCPLDPLKVAPGDCGCGESDHDSDDDGVADCIDMCPETPDWLNVLPNGCPAIGACCFPNRACFDETEPDACEGAGGRFQGFESSCVDGCLLPRTGDGDGDGNLDLYDHQFWPACMLGPLFGVSEQPCIELDLVGDDSVDLRDFSLFQVAFGSCVHALDADTDGDGIPNACDVCPNTPPAMEVDFKGCPIGGLPPEVTFLAPGSADVTLFLVPTFNIRFDVAIHEEGATGRVDVFYDRDRNADNGVTLLAQDVLVTTSTMSFALPSTLAEGTHNIGVTVRDGVNPSVTSYAQGRVIFVKTATLDVTEPNTSQPIRPGEQLDVRWTTNAPAGSGTTVDVFYRRLNASGQPEGPEIPILTGAAVTTTSARFSSPTSGLFRVTVRLKLPDNSTRSDDAPQPVRVSSLPTILWLGSLATSDPQFEGAIFGGVNFEDNAGASLAPAGDLNGDELDEFLIAARYGKPFFANPTGVGPGEAYLIYGRPQKLQGVINLNTAGTSALPGVTFAGIRTFGDTSNTDGLSDVAAVPDTDGDGRPELIFGFPDTDSECPKRESFAFELCVRGHFRPGGVVIVSSRNSILRDPLDGSPVIDLNHVGQSFQNEFPGLDESDVLSDEFNFDEGNPDSNPPEPPECIEGTDGFFDTVVGPQEGFSMLLAPPYYMQLAFNPPEDWFLVREGEQNPSCPEPYARQCARYYQRANVIEQDETEEQCVTRAEVDTASFECWVRGIGRIGHGSCPLGTLKEYLETGIGPKKGDVDFPSDYLINCLLSGFYPLENVPREPLGAKVLGRRDGDKFGTSIASSNSFDADEPGGLIITAPDADATTDIIDGISNTIGDSGVAYLPPNRHLWGRDNRYTDGLPPPTPHQYVIDSVSHCATGRTKPLIDFNEMVGEQNDHIELAERLDDFNGDGRNDIGVGAPNAENGNGRVYIAYRRVPAIEGDFVLGKIRRPSNDPERLDGILFTGSAGSRLGFNLAPGFDFNDDGVADVVIGAPGGLGEVIIAFGDTGLISDAQGVSVAALLRARNVNGKPVAARITGNMRDTNGQFGFNVANAGDIDGDGKADLLISAPNATPRFDPAPTDGLDVLSEAGVDLDSDGQSDDVPGPGDATPSPSDDDDTLAAAGLVYVIYGKNRLDQVESLRACSGNDAPCTSGAQCPAGQTCQNSDMTINIEMLGGARLDGFIIAGRRQGDRLGGGDAGEPSQGGIEEKSGRGRSFGLSSAGDVDGDDRDDILIGAILADPRRDPSTSIGVRNGGEVYLIYSSGLD